MNTDDLIRALAEDHAPGTSPAAMLARTLPVAIVISLIAVWATLGLRSDLGHAMTSAVPLLRHVLTLALFAIALTLGWRILRPEGNARLWPLAVPAVAAAALLVWGLMTTPQEGWQMALEGKTQMVCLIAVPLLSIPPVTALLLAFRQGAVMHPALGGALAGLAGGGLGAAIYALHCIEDSPLFYVTWYGVAIAIVTAASALIGSRILRW
jgi:hypothetical protein